MKNRIPIGAHAVKPRICMNRQWMIMFSTPDVEIVVVRLPTLFPLSTLLIAIIPCIWLGITTNASNSMLSKWFVNSCHKTSAMAPTGDKCILSADFPININCGFYQHPYEQNQWKVFCQVIENVCILDERQELKPCHILDRREGGQAPA